MYIKLLQGSYASFPCTKTCIAKQNFSRPKYFICYSEARGHSDTLENIPTNSLQQHGARRCHGHSNSRPQSIPPLTKLFRHCDLSQCNINNVILVMFYPLLGRQQVTNIMKEDDERTLLFNNDRHVRETSCRRSSLRKRIIRGTWAFSQACLLLSLDVTVNSKAAFVLMTSS